MATGDKPAEGSSSNKRFGEVIKALASASI